MYRVSLIKRIASASFLLVLLFAFILPTESIAQYENPKDWDVHDKERPQPRIVDTGKGAQAPTMPPSDAIVLFDGYDLEQWEGMDGSEPEWFVENGYFEVLPGSGGIKTKQGFGDVQLHIEWASPDPPEGEGQDKGNSGVFLMGMYEVQVLNSYENKTYPDGQASAVYGQYPPLVNAMRAPGEWQTYDIIFRAPRFKADGSLMSPATVTVLHNGVLTQNHVPLTGPSGHYSRPAYEKHEDRLPISLQDHDHPVRFRNVWVREL